MFQLAWYSYFFSRYCNTLSCAIRSKPICIKEKPINMLNSSSVFNRPPSIQPVPSLCITGSGVGLVRLWFDYGSAMVRLWFDYGSAMVQLWFSNGSAMVRLWFGYGSAMVRLGSAMVRNGSTMVQLWFGYGLAMVGYGSAMVRLWFGYGSAMVGRAASTGGEGHSPPRT